MDFEGLAEVLEIANEKLSRSLFNEIKNVVDDAYRICTIIKEKDALLSAIEFRFWNWKLATVYYKGHKLKDIEIDGKMTIEEFRKQIDAELDKLLTKIIARFFEDLGKVLEKLEAEVRKYI